MKSGEEQEGFRHDAPLPVGEELEADRTGADLADWPLETKVGAAAVLIPRTIVSPFRIAHVDRLCRGGAIQRVVHRLIRRVTYLIIQRVTVSKHINK